MAWLAQSMKIFEAEAEAGVPTGTTAFESSRRSCIRISWSRRIQSLRRLACSQISDCLRTAAIGERDDTSADDEDGEDA